MQSTPRAAPGRNLSIDSLRGVALILMVAGHVIGNVPNRGMQVSDDSYWRLFYWLLEDIRMPLFTVLSGMVYAHRPLLTGRLSLFVQGKARRLLVPMIVVGTAYFLLQLLTPGTNSKPDPSEYWRIFFFGYEHLWFVQAVFLIFIVVGILDRIGAVSTPRRWAVCTAIGCLLYVLVHVPGEWNVFSWVQACRLLPFFLIGYGLHRYARVLITRSTIAVAGVILAVFLAFKLAPLFSGEQETLSIVSLGLGLSAVTCLVAIKSHLTWGPLAWLGRFSFGVYLLHVFGAAATRIVLTRAGIDAAVVMFVACLVIGIATPVIFELVLGRYAVISWAILGQKPRRTASKQGSPSPVRSEHG